MSFVFKRSSGLGTKSEANNKQKTPILLHSIYPKQNKDKTRTPDFSKGIASGLSRQKITIQPKLKIGQPGDKYEQEADRIANLIVGMNDIRHDKPRPFQNITRSQINIRSTPAVIQQVYSNGEKNNSRSSLTQVSHATQSNEAELASFPSSALLDIESELPPSISLPSVESRFSQLEGKGQPLSESELSYFEPRFGVDFSDVRLHVDSIAHESTRQLNARAFTYGKHIVFNPDYYQNSIESRKLMAHELTHVIQQQQYPPTSNMTRIQLNPDVRFGRRIRILRIPWHENYEVFRQRVRNHVIRQLEVPITWIDYLLHARHTGNLRSAYEELDRAAPLRSDGVMVTIQADYRALHSVGASELVFRIISIPSTEGLTTENETPSSEHVVPPRPVPQNEVPAAAHTQEERDATYYSTRRAMAAFVFGTRLYEQIVEPLHGRLQLVFDSSHPWTQRIREHPHMESVRENIRGVLETYYLQSLQAEAGVTPSSPVQLDGRDNFSLNTLTLLETAEWLGSDTLNWLTNGTFGQESAWIFGSFRLFWHIRNPNCDESNASANVDFYAFDILHLGSATRIPITNRSLFEDQPFGQGMPLNDIPVFWYWREQLAWP